MGVYARSGQVESIRPEPAFISSRILQQWGMRKSPRLSVRLLGGLLLALAFVASSGCASKPKPDWNQRVGNFTFEDAVAERGVPVASIPLQDGSRVAEWFLKPGPQFSFGLGTGAYGPSGGVGVSQGVAIPTPGHYLRLVFGPDGKLQRWEKFRR